MWKRKDGQRWQSGCGVSETCELAYGSVVTGQSQGGSLLEAIQIEDRQPTCLPSRMNFQNSLFWSSCATIILFTCLVKRKPTTKRRINYMAMHRPRESYYQLHVFRVDQVPVPSAAASSHEPPRYLSVLSCFTTTSGCRSRLLRTYISSGSYCIL